MKKPKLLLAALVLLIGAASAASSKPAAGVNDSMFKQLSRLGGH